MPEDHPPLPDPLSAPAPGSGDRPAAGPARPAPRRLRALLATDTGSAALLLVATVVALVWANSPLSGAYEDLWGAHVRIGPAGGHIDEDLRHWVDDGLMALFFYVVGLEIRRELVLGELRDRRAAAVPAVAALAGMVVPALVFTAVNAGGDGARGWGIVMATDIAFVLGALALLGPRVPSGVRVFLLTLAIVDDIGAIAVIAVFYADSIDLVALAAAGGILVAILLLRRFGPPWRGPAYLAAGVVLWVATLESGVHPTIAGVAMGLLTAVGSPRGVAPAPSSGAPSDAVSDRSSDAVSGLPAGPASDDQPPVEASPNERFQRVLHPWTSVLVVPLFALANAGVPLGGDVVSRALTSPVTLGVIAGLVVGKALGIGVGTAIAVRVGVGPLPRGMRSGHLPGAAALAGIGFTVSLFVTDLAFQDQALRDEAKIGVLVASAIAAVLGLVGLARRGTGPGRRVHVVTDASPPGDRAPSS